MVADLNIGLNSPFCMLNVSPVRLALRLGLALAAFTATDRGVHAQGPLDGYLKGRGVLDLAPSFSFMSGNTFMGVADARYDLPWRGSMLGLFGEYGLSERVDIVATGAYIFTSENSGLQDGSLHVKYRPFYRERDNGERIGVLLATGLQFPLARYEIINAGALGQRALTVPLALMGQWETVPGVFFHLQAAYHHRLDRLQEMDVSAIRQQRPDFQPVEPASFYTALFKVGFPARRFYTDAGYSFSIRRGDPITRPMCRTFRNLTGCRSPRSAAYCTIRRMAKTASSSLSEKLLTDEMST